MVALIERSSELVGFADLGGKPEYLNAAGRELLGLSDIEDVSILDFLAPEDRAQARSELMPQVIKTGRWLGELNFRHLKTGDIIPCLVDWFRIDEMRSGRAMNMAMVGHDLRARKNFEADFPKERSAR